MKSQPAFEIVALVLLALLTLNSQISTARAQATAFTYQGRVLDHGTNFTGAGQFQFALVTSTNISRAATATANTPSGGFITGYNVTAGGNGYLTPPTVTVSGGGGSGAAATANLNGGVVTSLSVANPGNGAYTSAPTVTVAPPPPSLAYTTYWSNDGTSVNGSEPGAAVTASVAGGLFTVVLGDTTVASMAAISPSLFAQPNLQLRIWFNDGTNGFAVLSPAQYLTPTPYAISAENVAGAITVQNNTDDSPSLICGSSVNFATPGVLGATISGGGAPGLFPLANVVTDNYGTVGGGAGNTGGFFATVGGGEDDTAGNIYATVSGGENNTASGPYATVGGGYNNTASGACSFAAGFGANALHTSSFVWNDDEPGFSSTAAYQFSVHAFAGVRLVGNVSTGDISLSENGAYHNLSMSGGNSVGYLYGAYNYGNQDGIQLGYNWYADAGGSGHVINTGGATSRIIAGYGEIMLDVGGVNAAPNTTMLHVTTSGVCVNGTISNCSDRNVKQDFADVNPAQILEKVLQLSVREWSYKLDAATRHLGPMAQDFYAAFSLGLDDKHIATIDESGVAFAAIQGLNQKLESENAALKARLDKLEKLINLKNESNK